ncbi:MAG: hypothetical protein U0T02_07525 [Solirubrobacteraceae bacterium]
MTPAHPIVESTADSAPGEARNGKEAGRVVELPLQSPTAMERHKQMDIERLKAEVAGEGYAVDARAVAEAILRRVTLRRAARPVATPPPRLRAAS